MSTFVKRSLAAGEITPSLYSRVDLGRYQSGLRTCRNMFIMRHGGVANRPGTKFIGEVFDSSRQVRLIPFQFSQDETYILELGHLYMRIMRDGEYLSSASVEVTGVTNGTTCRISTVANPDYLGGNIYDPIFVDGDHVTISGTGIPELDGRTVMVDSVNASPSNNTFDIFEFDGTPIDSTSFTPYVSGGSLSGIYQAKTIYPEEYLREIQYVQSADVMTLTHRLFPPKELKRYADDNWIFTDIDLNPSLQPPTNFSLSGGFTGSKDFVYVVTSVKADTFEESFASIELTRAGAETPDVDNPITISWDDVGAAEYNVYRLINGKAGLLGVAVGTSFDDIGTEVDSSISPPVDDNPFQTDQHTIVDITNTSPAVLRYSDNLGIANGPGGPGVDYLAEDEDHDIMIIDVTIGMQEISGQRLIAKNVDHDTDTFELYYPDGTPVDATNFSAHTFGGKVYKVGNYPQAVAYVQQRLALANSVNSPEKVWLSRIGQYKNFTNSSPIQDADGIKFTIAGRQVSTVKHLLDLRTFIVFTESGEWTIGGNDASIISPTSIVPIPQSYNGASELRPLPVDMSALYVQARGTIVRDLAYEFSSDGYQGSDLTIFSAHLFDDYTLVDWTYQKTPHSVVWAVRDDGVLLSLTYVREQQMIAWARHDFDDGFVESVASVPEGREDAVYVVVRREINGETKRYVERLDTRQIIGEESEIGFMDSHLIFDGRNSSDMTMTLSGGTNWTYDETIVLTSSEDYFSASDVGNDIQLTDSEGELIRANIISFTSVTEVNVRPHKTVSESLRAIPVTDWAKAVDQLSGLWHLEGKEVSITGDGHVIASPYNISYNKKIVENGAITLAQRYSFIHVGLPYISDVETLDIDTNNAKQANIIDQHKLINMVMLYVEETRGLFAGPKFPTGDDKLENLREFKLRDSENYDDPVKLRTQAIEVNIRSEWNSNGRIAVRQVDPLPVTILSLAPIGSVPVGG